MRDGFAIRRACLLTTYYPQLEDVAPLARQAGKSGSKDADIFFKVIDQLMYHGMISELIDMLRLARSWVSGSNDLVPWAVDEFNDTACHVEMLDHMQRHASVKPDAPALLERLRLHVDPDPRLIAEHLDRFSGTSDSHWTFADFLAVDGSGGEETLYDTHDVDRDDYEYDDCEDADYARIAHNVWCLAGDA
jgi:hypothetical protein